MSEAEEPVQNGTAEEEKFEDAEGGEELKEVKIEVEEAKDEPAENGVPAEEDRTEDQVPDITGTENVDPMTTSMDGIEDIPKEEETPADEGGEEIKVEQFEDAPEAPAEEQEKPAEEAEQPAEEVEQEATEVDQTEEAVEETPAEDGGFELQPPPSPKRPRTPNDLDEKEATPALSAQGSAVESQKGSVPQSPVPSEKLSARGSVSQHGSIPATPRSTAEEPVEEGSQPVSNAVSQTGTPAPQSNAGSQPGTPRSAKPSEPATPRSKLANGSIPGSNAGSAVQTPRTGKSSKAFDFDKTSQKDDASVKSPAPRTPSVADEPQKTPSVAEEREPTPAVQEEREPTPAVQEENEEPKDEVEKTDEAPADESEEPKVEVEKVEADESAPRRESASPPPRHRAQSPSPPPRAARDTSGTDYKSYDEDTNRETIPSRLPTTTSFSSWNPPERESYKPISPWVDTTNKYKEIVPATSFRPSSHYTSIFDDQVHSGPFSQSLYSTNRLLERSRSRSRTRQKALRHSSFQRFSSQLPSPFRCGEYMGRSSSLSGGFSRPYTSFTSFLDYSGAKNYEMARYGSRGSLYDSAQALSRTNSRGNIDFYLGAGRMSRVDSFVNNLNSRYEWQFPASHELYRASSREQVGYAPLNTYNSYTNPTNTFADWTNERRIRSRCVTPVQWKSMYETRIGELQRSLSRERFVHDSPFNTSSYYESRDSAYDTELARAYGGFAKDWAGRL